MDKGLVIILMETYRPAVTMFKRYELPSESI